MDWGRNGASWPLSQHSRFVVNKPHRWHLQETGSGPLLLLIHGAGGATHSWRHLFKILTTDYRVVAVDLPGQGYTQLGAQQRCGLDPMAEDLLALCQSEDLMPEAIVGHSAGAAIALRMAEMWSPAQPAVIGINAALGNFDGVAGVVFPALAKAIAMLPMAADLFSATTSSGQSVERIIRGTGSALPEQDIALYRRLVADRSHVSATLQMMAQWKLDPLLRRLPQNTARTLLIVAENDTAVPPETSRKVAARMPDATCVTLPGLGHLAHEEDPGTVALLIRHFLNRTDL